MSIGVVVDVGCLIVVMIDDDYDVVVFEKIG